MFLDGREIDELAWVRWAAEEICRRGSARGRAFTAGPWAPAVPDGYSFAVFNRRGQPVMRAHDSFEVAKHFARLERGDAVDAGAWGTVDRPTDAELTAFALQDDYEYTYRWDSRYPDKEDRR